MMEAACFNSKCKFNEIKVHKVTESFYCRDVGLKERKVKRTTMAFAEGGVTLFFHVCEDCSDSYKVDMRKVLSVMND